MLKILFGSIAGLGMIIGGFFGMHTEQPPQAAAPVFGAYNPTGGGTYRLGQSIGTTDTSIKLSAFKEPVSNIPYTMTYLNSSLGYGTISPQSTVSEFVSFTGITQNSDGSATLTGVTRGLSRTPGGSACVASTTLAQPHAGQSIFILSNSPCFQAEYAVKRNNESITGAWTFASTSAPKYDLDDSSMWLTATGTSLVDLYKLNATAFGGGVVSVATGGTGGTTQPLNMLLVGSGTNPITSTSSPTVAYLTATSSTATSTFGGHIALTGSLNVTGSTTVVGRANFMATTTIGASGTSSNPIILNGLAYSFPATRGASSSIISDDGKGSLSENSISQLISSSALGLIIGTTTAKTVTQATEQDLSTLTIPANTLGTGNATLYMRVPLTDFNGGGSPQTAVFKFYYGSALSTCTTDSPSISTSMVGDLEFRVTAANSASKQYYNVKMNIANSSTFTPTKNFTCIDASGSSIDSTSAQTMKVTASWSATTGNPSMTAGSGVIYLIK